MCRYEQPPLNTQYHNFFEDARENLPAPPIFSSASQNDVSVDDGGDRGVILLLKVSMAEIFSLDASWNDFFLTLLYCWRSLLSLYIYLPRKMLFLC
ncbi:MAG: hypothetical protein F6K54_33200 [Okeania sp. SIO3B5]|uniref:hypothetical protein n=1 Tax=Okeania sp. SIO3B5 TaxID=2607811 RepID=UPI001400147D|nr:hypothetical protein [Okeania sp. SIO3B5]NEO57504.1 hypothetical protein [Okeania sp. SIO3B5]